MIEIHLNGEKTKIEPGTTIEQLIGKLGLGAKWVVAELNGKALVKADYAQTSLYSGDRVELVRAVSGG